MGSLFFVVIAITVARLLWRRILNSEWFSWLFDDDGSEMMDLFGGGPPNPDL